MGRGRRASNGVLSMDRRIFQAGIAIGTLLAPFAARAQAVGRNVRIGILALRSPKARSVYIQALLQGFQELGYVEGRTSASTIPMQTVARIACRNLPPSWCAVGSMRS